MRSPSCACEARPTGGYRMARPVVARPKSARFPWFKAQKRGETAGLGPILMGMGHILWPKAMLYMILYSMWIVRSIKLSPYHTVHISCGCVW